VAVHQLEMAARARLRRQYRTVRSDWQSPGPCPAAAEAELA